MKKLFVALFMLSLFVTVSNAQSSGFGAGLILGNPTGLSAKLYTGPENAFQFAMAWNFKDSGHLTTQADYLWHFAGIPVKSGKLPLYVGIGGYIVFADDAQIGARIPVGLDYQFAKAPIDVFVEIVPSMQLVSETDFDIHAGVGVRFWFK